MRAFLGLALTEATPDHSSLTRIRKRLPEEVFEEVFTFVLQVAVEHGLLKGKTIAVDATTLEANAAMKSMVRRDTGEDWKAYVRRLAEAEGIEQPTDEELRRFDRKRKKKTSNEDWESATDPDSRMTKMKDGRTHLAYKAEHAVDLESELIVAAVVYPADAADSRDVADDDRGRPRAARGGREPAPRRGGGGRQGLPQGRDAAGPGGGARRCARTWPSRSAKIGGGGRTSPMASKRPCTGTGGASAASGGGGWAVGEASAWNGRSPTCARPGAGAARGSGAS